MGQQLRYGMEKDDRYIFLKWLCSLAGLCAYGIDNSIYVEQGFL